MDAQVVAGPEVQGEEDQGQHVGPCDVRPLAPRRAKVRQEAAHQLRSHRANHETDVRRYQIAKLTTPMRQCTPGYVLPACL